MVNQLRYCLTVVVLLALVVVSFGAVHQASAQAQPVATVIGGALHIRSGPGTAYSVVATVYGGTTVILLGRTEDGSWAKVQIPSGVQGWASTRYLSSYYPMNNLTPESVAPPANQPGAFSATITGGALNVRSGPGLAYSIVTAVYGGTPITILTRNEDGSWLKVQLADGTQGWVNSGHVATPLRLLDLTIDPSIGTYPTYSVAPTTPTTPTGYYRSHTVQAGENLYRISVRYNVSMATLQALNGITNPSLIYAGQVLLIP